MLKCLNSTDDGKLYHDIMEIVVSKQLWLDARWNTLLRSQLFTSAHISNIVCRKFHPLVDRVLVTWLCCKVKSDAECVVESDSLMNDLEACLLNPEEYLDDKNYKVDTGNSTIDESSDTRGEMALMWRTLRAIMLEDDEEDNFQSLCLFFEEFMDGLQQYPALSLSAMWKKRGITDATAANYVGEHVGTSLTSSDYDKLSVWEAEDIKQLLRSPANLSVKLPSINASHDPVGIIQNLFSLAENVLMRCIFTATRFPGLYIELLIC